MIILWFNFSWQAVNPVLQHLKAILAALNLPEPTKESTVFELFSQIETKVGTIGLSTSINARINRNVYLELVLLNII